MQVKLLVARASVAQAQNVGDVVEVSQAEGLRMIASAQAVAMPIVPENARKSHAGETRRVAKRN